MSSAPWIGRASFGPVCALCLVAACQRGAGNGAIDAGPLVVGPENVVKVTRGQLEAGPLISGALEPREQARVRSRLSGTVDKVAVELGQQVKKGQVLARIDDRAVRQAWRSAQVAVRSAQAELKLAQRQARRSQQLVRGGAIAQTDLESAQNAVTAARARLSQAQAQQAQAKEQLDAAILEAPITGVVSERAVNAGDVVAPGTALFTVIDPSSMRLTASVPSEALSSLEVGRPVQFTVRGLGDRHFEGRIERVAPAADPITRQLTVLVELPNAGGELVAGLFAEGRIVAQTRKTLSVPFAAVEQGGDRATVKRVRNGVVEEVEVRTGLRDDATERLELVSGVGEGDLLLVGPARSIPAGSAVTVQGAGARPEAKR